jgi:hypothetical protein
MDKKSFIFYTSWKNNISLMDDAELRRFINNLITHTEGGEVELPSRIEQMVWNDLVEVLNHNERKRERAAERSRKNGQLGGRPNNLNNPVGSKETQQVIEEPSGLNNNLNNLLMVNGKWLMDNGVMVNGVMVNGVMVNGNMLDVNGNMLTVEQQEWNMLIEKKKSFGWNSLTPTEANRYYELKNKFKTIKNEN